MSIKCNNNSVEQAAQDNNLLGKRLRRVRVAAGMTQESLAKAAGVNRASIGAIENGSCDPRYSLLCKLAAALNIDVFGLLPGKAVGRETERERLLKRMNTDLSERLTDQSTSNAQENKKNGIVLQNNREMMASIESQRI